jgi:hypothetical protein
MSTRNFHQFLFAIAAAANQTRLGHWRPEASDEDEALPKAKLHDTLQYFHLRRYARMQ